MIQGTGFRIFSFLLFCVVQSCFRPPWTASRFGTPRRSPCICVLCWTLSMVMTMTKMAMMMMMIVKSSRDGCGLLSEASTDRPGKERKTHRVSKEHERGPHDDDDASAHDGNCSYERVGRHGHPQSRLPGEHLARLRSGGLGKVYRL